jgi:hypothetical protein
VLNVTPPGSAPVSLNVGNGNPLAVTLKVPSDPTVNVVALALVIAGASLTFRVKFCVAFGLTPLLAVRDRGYVPPVPGAGVPPRIPVSVFRVTPLGSVPVTAKVGAGFPVSVIRKNPVEPAVNVVLEALVIAGAVCGGISVVGGKATTTSLNAFVDPPIPESTFFVGLKNVVISNSNWHEYICGAEPINIG